MDEAIVDFLTSLEDAVDKANAVVDLIEVGNIEASNTDLEIFGTRYGELLSQLEEAYDTIGEELSNDPLDFDVLDDIH